MTPRQDSNEWLEKALDSTQRLMAAPAPEVALVETAISAADSAKGYLHWDKFRHRPSPKGWSPIEVWGVVKFRRVAAARSIDELLDKSGRPFRMVRTDALLASLHRIDTQEKLWKQLHAKGESPESEASYRLMASIEEAHSTSAIEGAVTTRRQSRELIRSGREPINRSERMVLNGMRALALIEQRIDEPLTPELLLELQRTLTADTLDDPSDEGAFRADNDVKVMDSATGETVFVPPLASELPERLANLCLFANSESSDERFLNPVTRAILLHHQLSYDHPFGDGNGRTARALCMWSLLRSGYHWFRSLSLSRAVERFKGRYYQSFIDVQSDDSDVTYFVRAQLRCIEHEIDHLAHFLGRRLKLERWLVEVEAIKGGLNSRQVAVLDYVLKTEGARLRAPEHAQFHKVSQPTAWKDLSQLRDQGLLRETKEGRASIYFASDKLLLLAKTRPRQ